MNRRMPNGTYGGVRGGLNSPYSIVPSITMADAHGYAHILVFYEQNSEQMAVLWGLLTNMLMFSIYMSRSVSRVRYAIFNLLSRTV